MGESICLIFIRWDLQILSSSLVPFCLQKTGLACSHIEDGAWNTSSLVTSSLSGLEVRRWNSPGIVFLVKKTFGLIALPNLKRSNKLQLSAISPFCWFVLIRTRLMGGRWDSPEFGALGRSLNMLQAKICVTSSVYSHCKGDVAAEWIE